MVPWNPFLMKKLLKSVVCGTHEQNTEIQFTGEKVKKVTAEKKKKKKFSETQTTLFNESIYNFFSIRVYE